MNQKSGRGIAIRGPVISRTEDYDKTAILPTDSPGEYVKMFAVESSKPLFEHTLFFAPGQISQTIPPELLALTEPETIFAKSDSTEIPVERGVQIANNTVYFYRNPCCKGNVTISGVWRGKNMAFPKASSAEYQANLKFYQQARPLCLNQL